MVVCVRSYVCLLGWGYDGCALASVSEDYGDLVFVSETNQYNHVPNSVHVSSAFWRRRVTT